MKQTIFLSGACKNVNPEERNSWRQTVEDLNFENDKPFIIFNPNKKFCYESEIMPSEKVVMDYFLYKLEHSDVVLVNLENSDGSVGTGMEVIHAVNHRKYIIGFNDSNSYGYTKACCNVVVPTLEDAWELLMEYFA